MTVGVNTGRGWSWKVDRARQLRVDNAVAAAIAVPDTSEELDFNTFATADDWQYLTAVVYRTLGEIHKPTGAIAKKIARLDWTVLRDGVELSPEQAGALIDEITSGMGEDETARQLSLNYQVPGDCYYLQEPKRYGKPVTDENPLVFRVVSVLDEKARERFDQAREDGRFAIRFYNPDPFSPSHADSPVRAALEPAIDLITLTALSKAQSNSRIVQAGIMLWPNFTDDDTFYKAMQDAMLAAIKDPRSAAAFVPIRFDLPVDLFRGEGQGQSGDALPRMLEFDRSYDDSIPEKIRLCQERIAIALDIEPELLTGREGSESRWVIWLNNAEGVKTYVLPQGDLIGGVYAEAADFLYPGSVHEFYPDAMHLLSRESTIRDRLDTTEIGATGFRFLRAAVGADDDDAPTAEDLEIMMMLKGATPREVLVEENPGPPPTTEADEPVAASLDVGKTEGVMFMARLQARQKLGAKLRNRLRKTPSFKLIDGVPDVDVAAVLGRTVVAEHLDVDSELVECLAGFTRYWTDHGVGVDANTATLLLAVEVADSLYTMSDRLPVIPAKLAHDLHDGYVTPKPVAAALGAADGLTDLDKLAADMSKIDAVLCADGIRFIEDLADLSPVEASARVLAYWPQRILEAWKDTEALGVPTPASIEQQGLADKSAALLASAVVEWLTLNQDREIPLLAPTGAVWDAIAVAGGE